MDAASLHIALWGLALFLVLGLMFGFSLAAAAMKFHVETNPLVDRVRACPFDALSIGAGGIAQVDVAKCTGCAICVPVCPKDLFTLYPRQHRVELSCVAREKQAVVRATCMVGCTLCRKCVAKCPAGAIEWDGRTILIDHEKCVAYGPSCNEACVDICPSTILHRVGQSPRPELPAEEPATVGA